MLVAHLAAVVVLPHLVMLMVFVVAVAAVVVVTAHGSSTLLLNWLWTWPLLGPLLHYLSIMRQ